MIMEFVHKSVLLEESINWLITDKDGIYVELHHGWCGTFQGFANAAQFAGHAGRYWIRR